MTRLFSIPSHLILTFAILILTVCEGYRYYDSSEVNGYHFHVYFYDGVAKSTQEALSFRDAIQNQIFTGKLPHCIVKQVNMGPYGPHLVGNFETCCNKTSITQALSFFMLNHGNLTVLFHPLTRYEKLDHTGREMFLGPRLPMDVSMLANDLQDNLDLCNSREQLPTFSFGRTSMSGSRVAAPQTASS